MMKTLHLFVTAMTILSIVQSCKKKDSPALATILTTTPGEITATGAQTGGTITGTGNSTITQSGICWAFHSNPTVGDSIVEGGQMSDGAFQTTLSNLNSNTVYYVRAYAINGIGTAYGLVDSFTTSKGLATVSTAAISNIAPLSAHGGGTVSNSGGTPVTARGICWSTSAHPTTGNFKTSDSTGLGTFVDSMADLASQTVYYVRAYATNSAGTAYGNELTFTSSSANTVTDIDGNVYPYVQIGAQYWMTMNLKATRYQNGDQIINGLTAAGFDFNTDTLGAYTFPNGDSTKNNSYGKLYNTFAVNDVRNACPVGWHVPSDGEWQTLELIEGLPADSVTRVGYRGMIGPVLTVGGTSGLNLQKGGFLLVGSPSTYYDFNTAGFYFSSTTINVGIIDNWYRAVDLKSGNPGPIYRNISNYVMSVRCIKN